jgi:Family of unknown function (DUF6402)
VNGPFTYRKGKCLAPVTEVDKTFVQALLVQSVPVKDRLDDMFAARANFQLRMAIQFTACKLDESRYDLKVREVGVYVWDTYDFEDGADSWISQPLPGPWGYVNNKDLREWRKASSNTKGGDFLVYSNIKRTSVTAEFWVK